MRLSLLTDYSLRTLIYLAGRQERVCVDEIARFYRISAHHLAKVAQRLSKLGYVRSIRGLGGGLELGRPADAIRLGELVAALEGNLHLLECVGTPGVCVIQPGCKLRSVLAEAERVQFEYLNAVRLSDLVEPGGQLREFVPLAVLSGRPRAGPVEVSGGAPAAPGGT